MSKPNSFVIDAKLASFKDEIEVHYSCDETGLDEIIYMRTWDQTRTHCVDLWQLLSDKGKDKLTDEFLAWHKKYLDEKTIDSTNAYDGSVG